MPPQAKQDPPPVDIEHSKALRQQRSQARFRDRGGIFVPTGADQNVLADILLGKASPLKKPRKLPSTSPAPDPKARKSGAERDTDVRRSPRKRAAYSDDEGQGELRVLSSSTAGPSTTSSQSGARRKSTKPPAKRKSVNLPTEESPQESRFHKPPVKGTSRKSTTIASDGSAMETGKPKRKSGSAKGLSKTSVPSKRPRKQSVSDVDETIQPSSSKPKNVPLPPSTHRRTTQALSAIAEEDEDDVNAQLPPQPSIKPSKEPATPVLRRNVSRPHATSTRMAMGPSSARSKAKRPLLTDSEDEYAPPPPAKRRKSSTTTAPPAKSKHVEQKASKPVPSEPDPKPKPSAKAKGKAKATEPPEDAPKPKKPTTSKKRQKQGPPPDSEPKHEAPVVVKGAKKRLREEREAEEEEDAGPPSPKKRQKTSQSKPPAKPRGTKVTGETGVVDRAKPPKEKPAKAVGTKGSKSSKTAKPKATTSDPPPKSQSHTTIKSRTTSKPAPRPKPRSKGPPRSVVLRVQNSRSTKHIVDDEPDPIDFWS